MSGLSVSASAANSASTWVESRDAQLFITKLHSLHSSSYPLLIEPRITELSQRARTACNYRVDRPTDQYRYFSRWFHSLVFLCVFTFSVHLNFLLFRFVFVFFSVLYDFFNPSLLVPFFSVFHVAFVDCFFLFLFFFLKVRGVLSLLLQRQDPGIQETRDPSKRKWRCRVRAITH